LQATECTVHCSLWRTLAKARRRLTASNRSSAARIGRESARPPVSRTTETKQRVHGTTGRVLRPSVCVGVPHPVRKSGHVRSDCPDAGRPQGGPDRRLGHARQPSRIARSLPPRDPARGNLQPELPDRRSRRAASLAGGRRRAVSPGRPCGS